MQPAFCHIIVILVSLPLLETFHWSALCKGDTHPQADMGPAKKAGLDVEIAATDLQTVQSIQVTAVSSTYKGAVKRCSFSLHYKDMGPDKFTKSEQYQYGQEPLEIEPYPHEPCRG